MLKTYYNDFPPIVYDATSIRKALKNLRKRRPEFTSDDDWFNQIKMFEDGEALISGAA